MVKSKNLEILNLTYQDTLTYLGIVMTIGISFVVAIVFYEITAFNSQDPKVATAWIVTSAVITIIMALIYYSLHRKKADIRTEIIRELDLINEVQPKIISRPTYLETSGAITLSNQNNHHGK